MPTPSGLGLLDLAEHIDCPDMEGWKFWWGVAAFFLGGLATQLTGWLTYRRQRKDRAEDAQNALRQRREEFELQHLVEVNELLRSCMNQLGQYSVLTRHLLEAPADQRHEQLEEAQRAAADSYIDGTAALHAQVGFILDDNVRTLATEALSLMDQMYSTRPSGSDARRGLEIWLKAGEAVNRTYDALSARVRALYAGRA